MDYYKVRLKLAKDILPKFKDEEIQWKAVKKLVKDGKGEIVLFAKSDDDFSRPEGLQQFAEWNKKFTSDYFLEFSILLSEEEAADNNLLNMKLYYDLESCNIVDYSYEIDKGRFEAWAFFDNSNFNESGTEENEAIEEKKPAPQIDMFKKNRKSK